VTPAAHLHSLYRSTSTHRDLLALGVLITVFATACSVRTGSGAAIDQQFIDMMVPHHQGAVEMGRIAESRAERIEIKEMAASIIRSQDQEIQQMKAWRQAWFGSAETPPMERMPMIEGMPGHSNEPMNMAQDVDYLRRAPEPFDRAFIEAMIPHHLSAIDAAKAVEGRTQREEVKQLARAIIADQQREIEQMRAWHLSWFGTPAPTPPTPRMGH
jgi:uncharacterized protein (DUF305 family)